MADKDVIVNNKETRAWHAKTTSKIKQMRLMAGAYHELSKEPNNGVLFESALKFMGERIVGKAPGIPAKPFGQFKHDQVKYYKATPLLKKRKFWIFLLGLLYLVIGFVLALMRHKKRLLLTWPKLLKK